MQPRDIPNLISVLRIFLSIPVAWLLLDHRFDAALILFAIAGISDGLDGFLAKRYDWRSQLGGMLDPLADKVLLVSSFLCLGWLGFLPVWLVMLVIFRDLLIVTGALIYHYRVATIEATPSLISKLNTALQIILVLAVVLDRGQLQLPQSLLHALIWGVCATTLVSGGQYVWVWSRRAARATGTGNGNGNGNGQEM